MKAPRFIYAADLFCGAGGASAGLHRAAERLSVGVDLVAVNHWPVAIETHSANFAGVKHYCASVDNVPPREAVPGGKLDLLLAGPACTHHSRARGAKPKDEQQRVTAFDIIEWLKQLDVTVALIENVEDFRTWGPLYPQNHPNEKLRGKPIPDLKGAIFREFVAEIEALGYRVEWRVLNAANFGDATRRHRLFIQCRKAGRMVWPKPTHYAPGEVHAFPGGKPYVTARAIIDWTMPGQSIFGRKKPLEEATMKRIFAGLRKFSGLPFVLPVEGFYKGNTERSIDEPINTVTQRGAGHLVQPFLFTTGGPEGRQGPRSLEEPIATIIGRNHTGLVEPFVVVLRRSGSGKHDGQARPYELDEPLPTICAGGNHFALCEPFLVKYHGGEAGAERGQSVDTPLLTVDTSNRFGLVEPFLVSYHGNDDAHSVDEPLRTVETKDRFALVEPLLDKGDVIALLDIRFRMLQPHELAAAHSFPRTYHFAGNQGDQVKQIGNSWPVNLAAALCEEILKGLGASE